MQCGAGMNYFSPLGKTQQETTSPVATSGPANEGVPLGAGVDPRRCPWFSKQQPQTTSRSLSHENVHWADKKPGDQHGLTALESRLWSHFALEFAGGSGSGKTSVAERIISLLDIPWVTLLRMDSFYKSLTDEQCKLAEKNEFNFDHPSAIDFDLLLTTLRGLKKYKRLDVPVYNFKTHRRESNPQSMYGAAVLIFEGILAFHLPEIVQLLDLKIFLHSDSDERLARRLLRDVKERGREPLGVIDQYLKFVKPAFDAFMAPARQIADVIIPRGLHNHVAMDILMEHVRVRLRQRCSSDSRATLAATPHDTDVRPPSLHVLPQTPQVRGIHAIIRDESTPRDQFVFYSDRIARLLVEKALSMQNFKSVTVNISDKRQIYSGKIRTGGRICAVSILRSGQTLETSLRSVVKDCTIGEILIQTDLTRGNEPALYYLLLPEDIAKCSVILMDSQVATGAAAMMAIRILIEHNVPEQNISLVSVLMSEIGANCLAYAFPRVNLITSAVDKNLSEKFDILPGVGNFSDRYYGTD